MYHLLSEMLLFHDSDTGMKSRSRKTQAPFTTDLWWQWQERCSKLDFHDAAVSFLGYCTCDMCHVLPTLTLLHSDHVLRGSCLSFPALQSSSAPLPPPSTQLLWLSEKLPWTEKQRHSCTVWKRCSPLALALSAVPIGRQASCRANEEICSLQLCSFLEINLSNIRRRENGIVYKITDFQLIKI